jgi:hypothetical protein
MKRFIYQPRRKSFLVVLSSLLLMTFTVQAQSLLDDLGTGDAPAHPVYATFKDTRIINVQSNETPGRNVMHFVIAHRFGQINEGAYALWGLDNASMRMAFDYGLTDRICLSVGRSTFQKTFESSLKMKLLQQQSDDSVPVGITLYGVTMARGDSVYAGNAENRTFQNRLSYTYQAIITRKWNEKFSLAIVPSFTHRNLVAYTNRAHDQWTIGGGGRYKLAQRISLNVEYHVLLNKWKEDVKNSLSMGVDIETGGHVFQLHITNSRGMFERAFLTETTGGWLDGALFFGFNLSRVFDF